MECFRTGLARAVCRRSGSRRLGRGFRAIVASAALVALLTLPARGQSSPASASLPAEAPSKSAASGPSSASSASPLPTTPRAFRDGGATPLPDSPTGGLAWQMLSLAGLVLLMGLACYIVMRKLLPRMVRPGGRNIQVVETAYLGPQKSVHLLRVSGETYLVASSRERISLLAKVSAGGGQESPRGSPAPAGGRDSP